MTADALGRAMLLVVVGLMGVVTALLQVLDVDAVVVNIARRGLPRDGDCKGIVAIAAHIARRVRAIARLQLESRLSTLSSKLIVIQICLAKRQGNLVHSADNTTTASGIVTRAGQKNQDQQNDHNDNDDRESARHFVLLRRFLISAGFLFQGENFRDFARGIQESNRT